MHDYVDGKEESLLRIGDEKIYVKGKNQHPIYEWLSSKNKNGWNNKSPSWNFYKYFINREGDLINYYPSAVSPLDTSITNLLSTSIVKQ